VPYMEPMRSSYLRFAFFSSASVQSRTSVRESSSSRGGRYSSGLRSLLSVLMFAFACRSATSYGIDLASDPGLSSYF
jgi:hypothetical protein